MAVGGHPDAGSPGGILGDRRRGALVVAPLIVGVLMYGHVANLVRPLHVPGIVQQAGWVALTVIAFVAAIRLAAPDGWPPSTCS